MKSLTLLSSICALCFLLPAPTSAQAVNQIWARQFNGPDDGSDAPNAVAVDSFGNVFVTGHSSPYKSLVDDYAYYTAKYSATNGALLWESHCHRLHLFRCDE